MYVTNEKIISIIAVVLIIISIAKIILKGKDL